MTTLDLELQKRNARFRAWRAFGMPLSARWQRSRAVYCLYYNCDVCQPDFPEIVAGGGVFDPTKNFLDNHWPAPRKPLRALRRFERWHLKTFLDIYGCPHLLQILDPEPPEVRAIYELELLAGEGVPR